MLFIILRFHFNIFQLIHFCGTDKSQDRVTYRDFVAGEIVSFIKAILYGECDELVYIEVSYLMV